MAIRITGLNTQILINPTTHSRALVDDMGWEEESQKRKVDVYSLYVQAMVKAEPTAITGATTVWDLQETAEFFIFRGDREVPENELGWNDAATLPHYPKLSDDLGWSDEAVPSIQNLNTFNHTGWSDKAEVCLGVPWGLPGVKYFEAIADASGLPEDIARANALFCDPPLVEVCTGQDTDDDSEVCIDIPDDSGCPLWYPGNSNPLGWSDHVTVNPEHSASDYLAWTEVVAATTTWGEDNLGWTDSALTGGGLAQSLQDDLSWDDSENFSHAANFEGTHDLGWDQSSAYYIESKCNTKARTGFEGTGAVPVPELKNQLRYESDFSFRSTENTTDIVTLRSPESDDIARLGYERINRETRGGEIDIYSDPTWAETEKMLFTIVAVKAAHLEEMQAFMLRNLGLEVMLQDWEGVIHQGLILTPGEIATEDGEGYWTLSFEFEGVTLDGTYIYEDLGWLDSASLVVDYAKSASDNTGWQDDSPPPTHGLVFAEASDDLSWSDNLETMLNVVLVKHAFTGDGTKSLDGTLIQDNIWDKVDDDSQFTAQGARINATTSFKDDGIIDSGEVGTISVHAATTNQKDAWVSNILGGTGPGFLTNLNEGGKLLGGVEVVARHSDFDQSYGHPSGTFMRGDFYNGPTEVEWDLQDFCQTRTYGHLFDGDTSSLDGETPDTGASDFDSGSNFKKDGSFAGDGSESGMYLPFTPVDGKIYYADCKMRDVDSSGESDQDVTFMLCKGVIASTAERGTDASGYADPTLLRAATIFKSQGGNNETVLGNVTVGTPTAFTDAAMEVVDTDLDMRIKLDTSAGVGNWTVTHFCKLGSSLQWLPVSVETALTSEDIGAIGVGIGSAVTGRLYSLKVVEDTETSLNPGATLLMHTGSGNAPITGAAASGFTEPRQNETLRSPYTSVGPIYPSVKRFKYGTEGTIIDTAITNADDSDTAVTKKDARVYTNSNKVYNQHEVKDQGFPPNNEVLLAQGRRSEDSLVVRIPNRSGGFETVLIGSGPLDDFNLRLSHENIFKDTTSSSEAVIFYYRNTIWLEIGDSGWIQLPGHYDSDVRFEGVSLIHNDTSVNYQVTQMSHELNKRL